MKAIVGGTLIDGTGLDPIPDCALLVDRERVVEVGPRDQVKYPADVEVIDVSGRTILPGLIDCHVHLAIHGHDPLTRAGLTWPFSYRVFLTAAAMGATLDAGYTTVRDGGRLGAGVKLAAENGLVTGPRLVISVNYISPTGGFADRRTPSGLLIPPDPDVPSGLANGVDGVRERVREMVRSGADVIKTFGSGALSGGPGHGARNAEYTAGEIRALVDEARSLDRKVMCHCLGGPGIGRAVEAGVHSIEHGTHLSEHPDVVKAMADRGIFYVPTFSVYHSYRNAAMLPLRRLADEAHRAHVESFQLALHTGVKVAAGSDMGASEQGSNALELQLMVEAGMTPLQALGAATKTAAECLGLDKELGTLEPGKLADLLVVEGNPLEDFGLLQDQRRIAVVMKGGEICVNRLYAAAR